MRAAVLIVGFALLVACGDERDTSFARFPEVSCRLWQAELRIDALATSRKYAYERRDIADVREHFQRLCMDEADREAERASNVPDEAERL